MKRDTRKLIDAYTQLAMKYAMKTVELHEHWMMSHESMDLVRYEIYADMLRRTLTHIEMLKRDIAPILNRLEIQDAYDKAQGYITAES